MYQIDSVVMKRHAGFTLIEVLIAALILALGLLGLAALQASGLRDNLSAYNRSQATQLAYDIVDKIRSNPSAAASYTVTPLPVSCPNGASPENCTACLTTANTCSPAQLAQRDLFDWNRNLLAAFPNGSTGAVVVNNGVYTVTISWSDNKDNPNEVTTFKMSFRL